MARKRSSPEAKAQAMPTANSLATRAQRLRLLVRERTQRDEQAIVAQGLETRREELRETVQVAKQLAAVLALLKGAELSVSLSQSALTQLCAGATALRRAFLDDPRSLAQPRAFDRGEYHRVLAAARETLLAAWRQHVAPPEGDGLAGVLERYEPFRAAAARLKEVQQSLSTLARTLPRQQDLQRVRELKEQAAKVLRGLSLDAALIDFLTQAQTTGFPLHELVENQPLVEQLRLPGLLACLRIVTA